MSSGLNAIVTGGSRGIGRAIAVSLGGAGWSVAVNYASSEEAARGVVDQIEAAGGRAVAIRANVAEADDRRRLLDDAVDALGPISLLVNNAGITSPDRGKDLLDASEQAFDTVIATNLRGPHLLTQLVARHMIETASNESATDRPFRAIVNIGSISAFAVSTDRADYCIARAATTMMTRVWAARLARHGIHVYEVRPGIIATDMTAPVQGKYDKLIHEQDLLPIARWGKPQDVADAVVMLAGGTLGYSTGETVHVDGGFHLRRL